MWVLAIPVLEWEVSAHDTCVGVGGERLTIPVAERDLGMLSCLWWGPLASVWAVSSVATCQARDRDCLAKTNGVACAQW
jgi:hypothetical protein